MRTGPLSVTVAAATRRRPSMLRDLIASWGTLEIPEDVTARFLVVENDTEPRSRAVIEEMAALVPGLDYVLETEPGIPFARNRAAREAIAQGSYLLAFMDDDEVARPDWLARFVAGYRASQAVLLGAPLRAIRPEGDLTRAQAAMYERVAERYREKEERAARRAGLDATEGVTIVTNNWLGETRLFSEHGIWFDETMRFTGGTDAKFYHDTRARGLPTGWVKDAIVSETIPPERLSFRYQMHRSRDQSTTNFRRKLDANPWAAASVLVSVPLKALSALGLAIALPLTGGRTILKLARTLGWITGRIGALLGRRSALYRDVTGN